MTHDEILDVLTRMETRVVRGFTKLGVDPCTRGEVAVSGIDEINKVAYVTNRDVTLAQVYKHLRNTVPDADLYAIKHIGESDVRDQE